MSDIKQVKPPLWQRLLSSERFKNLLLKATIASGFVTVPVIQKWFPGVTPDSFVGIGIEAVSAAVPMFIGWYRDHPDNFLARARKVINGGTASDHAVAATAATAQAAT